MNGVDKLFTVLMNTCCIILIGDDSKSRTLINYLIFNFNMSKTISIIIGLIFLLIGAMGYFPNSIVGPGAFFETNNLHNIVHVLFGLIIIFAAFASESSLARWLKIVGLLYLIVAVLGFFAVDETGLGQILGLIMVNSSDNWLHVVLGFLLLGIGYWITNSEPERIAQMQ